MPMKILVTGGAGYVGSVLVQLLLAAQYRVRVIDNLMRGGQGLLGAWANPGFEFVRGDLRDPALVEQALQGVEAVVHLAGIVGDPECAQHPELARAVNLEASFRLLDASRAAGVSRFVFASTCSNYGRMKDPSQYVDEDSELRPVSLYAETKVAVERALLDAATNRGMCCTPLRLATVFGVSPRMRFDLTVNEFTLVLLTQKRLEVFGEQFWRPYVHVRDVGRAVLSVLQAPPDKVRGQVFNVGDTTQNYQKQQLVEMILRYVPEAKIKFVPKTEDPRDYRVRFERLHSALGFQITRTVAEGIGEVASLVQHQIILQPEKCRNV